MTTASAGDPICGPKILILDDSDFDLRRVARMICEITPDVRVTATRTLREFQTAVFAEPFDLCLIDHSLESGKTSADAIDIIKSHTTAAGTPAVLVSGLSDEEEINRAVRYGFLSYLNKGDMTVGTLKDVVATALHEPEEQSVSQEDYEDNISLTSDYVASQYSDSTKALLSQIYKNTNFIRQCLAMRSFPSPEALDAIETSCFRIWRTLDAAEKRRLPHKRHAS
jgi:DNA-binding NtrC family response regulator